MKKRILIAALSVVLAALILLSLPNPQESGPEPTVPTGPTNQATTPTVTLPKPDPGVVRLYCCDESRLPILEELAAEYNALTGGEVILLTAGESGCQATLQHLMESEDPPTVLCLHSQADLKYWQSSLLNLRETAVAKAMYSHTFGLRSNGLLLAIPMELEAMGLLFNAERMAVCLTRNDITDFTSLTTAVQILKSNSLSAFSAIDWESAQALRLLKSSEADAMRAFLELAASYRVGDGDGLSQFAQGQSVFYLGSSDDYSLLEQHPDRSVELRNLDILPTYTNEGMHYLCTTAWGVNGNARDDDVEATLNFLAWLVTATEDAAAPVDRLQNLTPFAQATWYGNQLEKKIRGYMKQETAIVLWATPEAEDEALQAAFFAYLADPTDETWKAVTALLPEELTLPPQKQ